jgi:hypothetical protein
LAYGGAITWQSKLQSTVALSTAEAELTAANKTVREALWIRRLCFDMCIPLACPIPHTMQVWCDNQATIIMADNMGVSERTKHIDVSRMFVREAILKGLVNMAYISTDANHADMFTKALPAEAFAKHRKAIGLML